MIVLLLCVIDWLTHHHHHHQKHNVKTNRKIFDEAVNESIVYLTCMLLYYKVRAFLSASLPF